MFEIPFFSSQRRISIYQGFTIARHGRKYILLESFLPTYHITVNKSKRQKYCAYNVLISHQGSKLHSESKSRNSSKRRLKWYKNNLPQGNFSKYQVMSLGPRNCQTDLYIVIGDAEIDQKSEITLLGVTLDDQLTFSSHISKVCRKASCQTGVLLRLRNLIPTSAKLHIVKFAIIPQLTYCQTVWHFCRASDTRKLERIQERALRSVYCDNVSSYEKLLQRLERACLHYTREDYRT